MKNKQRGDMWLMIILVVALVVLAVWVFNKSSSTQSTTNNSTVSGDNTNSAIDTATVPAVSISYENALIKYKGARLQIEQNCQASPDKMTFKNNSYMMVDNRASVAHTVTVGSTDTIKAYGFEIVKLSSSKLPVTWFVNCDKSKNISSILIQK